MHLTSTSIIGCKERYTNKNGRNVGNHLPRNGTMVTNENNKIIYLYIYI